MDDLTLGLIYAIKHSKKSAKESIVDFLSEYTGTPKEHYDNTTNENKEEIEMSANVETMLSTREKPWHGLGT